MEKRAKRSPGRPTEFDRTAAVHAAMNKFWKHGFESVSASDIAEAMSISRSSFYNSFGDRETVFREAMSEYRAFAPDGALAGIGPDAPVAPAIRAVFWEICRVRAADPEARGCLIVNAVGQLVGVNAELGEHVADAIRAGARIYERLLEQAVARGEISRPANLQATALAFVAFVSGLNTISKVVVDERDLWQMCEEFLERHGFGATDAAP